MRLFFDVRVHCKELQTASKKTLFFQAEALHPPPPAPPSGTMQIRDKGKTLAAL